MQKKHATGILYAAEAISFTATDIRMLNNCVNRALYKIFGLSDKDNLLQLRQFIGLSSLSKLIEKVARELFFHWVGRAPDKLADPAFSKRGGGGGGWRPGDKIKVM